MLSTEPGTPHTEQPITITDSVVILRPLQPADAEEHLAGEDDEEIRWLSGGRSNLEIVTAWIKRNQKQWETGGPVRNFGIWDPVPDRLIGNIELNSGHEELDGVDAGQANLAYSVFPEARGHGHATRAVLLACEYARQIGVAEAVIRVHPENARSIAVARRAGFRYVQTVEAREGTLERWLKEL